MPYSFHTSHKVEITQFQKLFLILTYTELRISDSKYKYMQVSDSIVTNEEREALKAAWESKLGE